MTHQEKRGRQACKKVPELRRAKARRRAEPAGVIRSEPFRDSGLVWNGCDVDIDDGRSAAINGQRAKKIAVVVGTTVHRTDTVRGRRQGRNERVVVDRGVRVQDDGQGLNQSTGEPIRPHGKRVTQHAEDSAEQCAAIGGMNQAQHDGGRNVPDAGLADRQTERVEKSSDLDTDESGARSTGIGRPTTRAAKTRDHHGKLPARNCQLPGPDLAAIPIDSRQVDPIRLRSEVPNGTSDHRDETLERIASRTGRHETAAVGLQKRRVGYSPARPGSYTRGRNSGNARSTADRIYGKRRNRGRVARGGSRVRKARTRRRTATAVTAARVRRRAPTTLESGTNPVHVPERTTELSSNPIGTHVRPSSIGELDGAPRVAYAKKLPARTVGAKRKPERIGNRAETNVSWNLGPPRLAVRSDTLKAVSKNVTAIGTKNDDGGTGITPTESLYAAGNDRGAQSQAHLGTGVEHETVERQELADRRRLCGTGNSCGRKRGIDGGHDRRRLATGGTTAENDRRGSRLNEPNQYQRSQRAKPRPPRRPQRPKTQQAAEGAAAGGEASTPMATSETEESAKPG